MIKDGSITTVPGFLAGSSHCGLKNSGKKLDICIIYAPEGDECSGVFTTNSCKAAPVLLDMKTLEENNNIKAILGSGLLQYGAGFSKRLNPDESLTSGETFFSLMKKYRGKSIGLAHREWIEKAYTHYKDLERTDDRYTSEKCMAFLINYLCINITGNGNLKI